MALVTATLPTIGHTRGDEEVDVRSVLVALLNEINGNLDAENLKDASIPASKLISGAITLHRQKTYAVPGVISSTDVVPGYFHSQAADQTTRILKVRAKLTAGTLSLKLQRNGADLTDLGTAGVMNLTNTAATFTAASPIVLVDDDYIQVVYTAAAGAQNLSLSIVEEDS